MKIPRALPGTILVGIAVQTKVSSCSKKENPQAQTEENSIAKNCNADAEHSCPGCDMG